MQTKYGYFNDDDALMLFMNTFKCKPTLKKPPECFCKYMYYFKRTFYLEDLYPKCSGSWESFDHEFFDHKRWFETEDGDILFVCSPYSNRQELLDDEDFSDFCKGWFILFGVKPLLTNINIYFDEYGIRILEKPVTEYGAIVYKMPKSSRKIKTDINLMRSIKEKINQLEDCPEKSYVDLLLI